MRRDFPTSQVAACAELPVLCGVEEPAEFGRFSACSIRVIEFPLPWGSGQDEIAIQGSRAYTSARSPARRIPYSPVLPDHAQTLPPMSRTLVLREGEQKILRDPRLCVAVLLENVSRMGRIVLLRRVSMNGTFDLYP